MQWRPPQVDSCWPTPEQRLLLEALLRPAPAAMNALSEWEQQFGAQPPDYSSLTLMPLLYRRLEREGYRGPPMDQLQGVYRWSWHRNQVLFHHVRRALVDLHAAGIATLLLKGAALSFGAYQDHGIRVMGDCDVAVPHGSARQAAEVLRGSGWEPRWELTPERLGILHAMPFRGPAGAEIDLHWRIFADAVPSAAEESMWQVSQPVEFVGVGTRALSPPDQLLHLVVHGFLAQLHSAPVGWPVDAVAVLRRAGDDFVWDDVVNRAFECRFVATLDRGLRYLASQYDVPVPAAVLDRLQRLPVSLDERLQLWFRLHAGPRTPWGRAPLRWFGYRRHCDRLERRPSVPGFLRYWATQRHRPSVRALGLELALWPLRQVMWLAVGWARRLGRPFRQAGRLVTARLARRDTLFEKLEG